MKFCRNCGSALATPSAPGLAAMSPAAPIGGAGMPPPGPLAGPAPMPPSGQPGASPFVPPTAPPSLPPSYPNAQPPAALAPGSAVRAAQGSSITCPRCGTPTPVGFAFCQQCGLHMQALQPTDPGAGARPRSPSQVPPLAPAPATPSARSPIDPQAATLAADGVRAGSIQPPSGAAPIVPVAIPAAAAPSAQAMAQTGPAWGTAILVNRDGSDGQRFPLASEYLVIGRAGADIAFEDDRFLARQHARLERGGDGTVKIYPLDTLNGVFRKADAPVDLGDGMTVLVGREVLRYERVDAEETKVHPLVRHGVALFGSPPREPWGRLVQIVPSGGYRDVRHLTNDEVVLGREEGDIVFRDDAFMSRRHAAVTWDGKRAQITDLGSSNGTFIRITGATSIKNGDHVRMGDQLLRIELGR